MRKHITKLIALFLCLCVFGSGIKVYASDSSLTDNEQATIVTDTTNEGTNASTETPPGDSADNTNNPSTGDPSGSTGDNSTDPSTGDNTSSGDNSSGDNTSGGTTTPEEPPKPVVVPLTLSGKLSSTRTAQLTWNADDSNATYKLYRATTKTGKYSVITTVTGKKGTVKYNDPNLTLGKTYYYQVTKIKDSKTVDKSSIIAVKIKLTAPSSVKASVNSSNDIKLTWKKVSYATGYYVYCSTSKNGTYKKIATTTNTYYTDKSPASAK
ncbi:MAG: hypothetical protein ACI4UH_07675, partial [Dorea sp.]